MVGDHQLINCLSKKSPTFIIHILILIAFDPEIQNVAVSDFWDETAVSESFGLG